MRKAVIEGKEIQLTEKQFKKLRSRFNPKNFKLTKYTYEVINNQECYFCKLYLVDMGCFGCPFGILENVYGRGCLIAIKSILSKNEKRVLRQICLNEEYVSYFKNSKAAEKLISKIFSAIEGFKKVKTRRRN